MIKSTALNKGASKKNKHFSIPSFDKVEVLKDFEIAFKSRIASDNIRRETLTGKAKFGLGSAGKELPQLAIARYFELGDYYSGYYRDATFMMRKELATVESIFAGLYGDVFNDPYSGGRQMVNHFATPFIKKDGSWNDQTNQYNVASSLSPLAGNVTHALGIALASKKYRELPTQTNAELFSNNGNEISICTLGDATTSEGAFFEALNAAGVMKVPLAFVIFDDGHGISVPTKYQTTKESISDILEGFRVDSKGDGAYIYTAMGWNYEELCTVFEEGLKKVRETHTPAVFHIKECTQPNGHSTSGSHQRYKSKERLKWEKEQDGLVFFENWIINQKLATSEELHALKKDWRIQVKESIQNAWNNFIAPAAKDAEELKFLYADITKEHQNEQDILLYVNSLKELTNPLTSHLLKHAEQLMMDTFGKESESLSKLSDWIETKKADIQSRYNTQLYSSSKESALRTPIVPAQLPEAAETVPGFQILNKNFEKLFEKYDNLFAFGEDLGKIGGVNQGMAGLQAKFGEERIFDVGIREWTIAGQGIGMAMRGQKVIAEIQYLDYIHYAFSPLADDLATLRYRSNGLQKSPAIIRTRGHRLEGIWHSGSPLAMLINSMRGIYICVPRNMTQAAGMYNTLLQSDDPAIVVECLNGYRKKETLPQNIGEFTVPLGTPEILEEGTDVTLVTYGSCVDEAKKACAILNKKGISVELIDVQTLLPFDLEHRIVESLKKTNRIVFLDEDLPGGTTAYMMQQVLEVQGGYQYLDSKPITISGKQERPPYGDDGDYYNKPHTKDIFDAIVGLMQEADPKRFA